MKLLLPPGRAGDFLPTLSIGRRLILTARRQALTAYDQARWSIASSRLRVGGHVVLFDMNLNGRLFAESDLGFWVGAGVTVGSTVARAVDHEDRGRAWIGQV